MPNPERLLIRDRRFALDYARRLVRARLEPLRASAMRCDNFENGQLHPKPPTDYTSVEALVMDVSDLAQTYGYLTALIETEDSDAR